MLNYVLFVLSLALCGVQGQRTTANIARAASSYMADIASSKVKTLNSVKTDIDVGNIKLPIPKGAPGVDMELSKYIAQAWRNSYSVGGFWFGHKNGGYTGYATTRAEKDLDTAQYTYKAEAVKGDRFYFNVDNAFTPSAKPRKTNTNYTITDKLWYLATMQPGAEKDAAWVPQVSFTSGKMNYFYTMKMYSSSTKNSGSLVGWGLRGIDAEELTTALATLSDFYTVIYAVEGKDSLLASSNATQEITKLNPNCVNTDCKNLITSNRYLTITTASAGDDRIAQSCNVSNQGQFTYGGLPYSVSFAPLCVGTNMNLKIVVASANGISYANAIQSAASNLLRIQLKPMSDDLNAMSAAFENKNLPAKFPPSFPSLGSKLQRYWAAIWRKSYSLGGLWMGMEDNSYIGYAAGAGDIGSGESQYTFIWGEGVNCPEIPNCDQNDASKCAAVTNNNCRTFWRAGANLVPTVPYRNKPDYSVVDKGWWKEAKSTGTPGWIIHYGTTVELPVANRYQPIFRDGNLYAVAIHQLDVGYGSSCNKVLTEFVAGDESLTVFVMTTDGALVATGGADKDIWDKAAKRLTKASEYSSNGAISTVAEAIGNKITGGAMTGKAGNYDYSIQPVDSAKSGNIDWVVVAARKTKEKTTEEKTTGEKASGVQIGTLVVSILTLLVALVLATKQPASERSKQSWANPVGVAMSANRA